MISNGRSRSVDEKERFVRTAVYEKFPQILEGLRHDFDELFSIVRTYASTQKYDHTARALNAIADLLVQYLRLRDRTILTTPLLEVWLGNLPRYDSFLVEQLDNIAEVHRSALASSDIRLSRQVLSVLRYVGVHSVKIRPFIEEAGQNSITNLVMSYTYPAVEQAASKGLDDITLQGCYVLSAVGRVMTAEGFYLGSHGLIGDLQKLAGFGIAQRKAFIIREAVEGIGQIMATALMVSLAETYTLQTALDALKIIATLEVSIPQPWLPGSQNVQTALGPFLDLTSPTSLAQLEIMAIRRISEAEDKKDKRLISAAEAMLKEFNDQLWSWFSEVGAKAAKTESFALHFIDKNIREIANQQLSLYEAIRARVVPPDESWRRDQFVDRLLHDFSWLIGATYWRIYDGFGEEIKTNLVRDFFGTLSQIGIRCVELHLDENAVVAAENLLTLAKKGLKKQVEHGYGPPRIAEHIARIGIVALKRDRGQVVNRTVDLLVEFQGEYTKTFRDIPQLQFQLLTEIDNLKRERAEVRIFADPTDNYFFSKINQEDIEKYLNHLQRNLR